MGMRWSKARASGFAASVANPFPKACVWVSIKYARGAVGFLPLVSPNVRNLCTAHVAVVPYHLAYSTHVRCSVVSSRHCLFGWTAGTVFRELYHLLLRLAPWGTHTTAS
mgnify:CR=1 FL=1